MNHGCKFILTIALGFFLDSNLFAQVPKNYAINGSFEEILDCPNKEGEIAKAKNYYSGIGTTTDLFARCANNDVGVPSNRLGKMNAFDGDNMAGIMATTKGYRYYDYIIGTLDYEQMTPGITYCVSMKVSLAYQSPWALDQLSLSFCDSNSWEKRMYGGVLTPFNPLVMRDYPITSLGADQDLTVREKWITVKGSITYQEGMKYFWIGANHKVLKTLTPVNDVQKVFNPDRTVYYYVDDVKIVDQPDEILLLDVKYQTSCKAANWIISVAADVDSVYWYYDDKQFKKSTSKSLELAIWLDPKKVRAEVINDVYCNAQNYQVDDQFQVQHQLPLNTYYPNPVTTENVKLNLFQKGEIETVIYDASGRKVRSFEFNSTDDFSSIQVPVGDLATAVYVIETRANGCVWVERIVVR